MHNENSKLSKIVYIYIYIKIIGCERLEIFNRCKLLPNQNHAPTDPWSVSIISKNFKSKSEDNNETMVGTLTKLSQRCQIFPVASHDQEN